MLMPLEYSTVVRGPREPIVKSDPLDPQGIENVLTYPNLENRKAGIYDLCWTAFDSYAKDAGYPWLLAGEPLCAR